MRTRFAVTSVLAVALLLPLAAAADASGRPKATKVSHCQAGNAEVVQAVDGRYVYEAWIGCGRSIGFARSIDGGRRFGPSQAVPGSHRKGLHSWDPALTVAADGTVYVAYMVGPAEETSGTPGAMKPAVAVSHDHGRSFAGATTLPVPPTKSPLGNFGDRPSIAVGPDGSVYVTWDYGPRREQVKVVCPPRSSCYFNGGDFNAVFQRSSAGGKTWTKLVPISPGYPLGGVYSAPIVAQRNGTLDVLYWQHPTDPHTLRVSPGREYFIRSTDGGSTWSKPVLVGGRAGTIGVKEWWIDGYLAVDNAGTLYASWDTQRRGHDTGWLAWSTNGGKRWSSPVRVASSRTEHLTEVEPAGRRNVYVGWQTVVRGKGYATFLRRYSPGRGWTGPAKKISPAYGNVAVWPGDTFGLSTKGGTALVSWGSAVKNRLVSDIWFAKAKLPAR
ncbi:MAG TPA: sialidase family protein [Gaiellaceae bacterium]|nr:sialidase family protein [Gaiellaceae bacterium]